MQSSKAGQLEEGEGRLTQHFQFKDSSDNLPRRQTNTQLSFLSVAGIGVQRKRHLPTSRVELFAAVVERVVARAADVYA